MDETYISNWRTLSKKVILETPFKMRLAQYKVVKPDKKIGTWFVVEKTPMSVVIPITSNKELVMVEQYRYPVGRLSWEFPMGAVETGTPIQVAKQELIEETGMTTSSLEEIASFSIAPGTMNQKVHVFVAKNLSQGEAHPEASEFFVIEQMLITKVAEMVNTGVIHDGPTICAFHYLEVYLKKQNKL